jgi:hypothetical protein
MLLSMEKTNVDAAASLPPARGSMDTSQPFVLRGMEENVLDVLQSLATDGISLLGD